MIVKKKSYQQTQTAYQVSGKELSVPELSWNPTQAYSQIIEGIAQALEGGLPKKKIIQVYGQALQNRDYGGALVGIHKKTMVAGSSTETMNKTSAILYELLGIPTEKPALVQIPGKTWADRLTNVYLTATKDRIDVTKRGIDAFTPGVQNIIKSVATEVQKNKFKTYPTERVENAIVSHMTADGFRHLTAIKRLNPKQVKKMIIDEIDEKHYGLNPSTKGG